MDEEELRSLFDQSDAFIGEWISTDVDAVLTNLLGKYPNLSNKELFLILEPPSGNLNSGSSSLSLIRNNTINHATIFDSYTNDELINYFKNTKRGLSFTNVNSFIIEEGASFNEVFNQLVLYKNLNDKDNLKNQILYTLKFLGYDFQYSAPNFTGTKSYGIYRDRWYSLDEYMATFFDDSRKRTIGILESTMYISSQQLHPTYEIIDSLESKGYNVIPVFAAGGSAEQLRVMVESWTSAGGDIAGFLENSSNYDTYVDAIVSMVAYGVGGENFTKATDFFEELGVAVSDSATLYVFAAGAQSGEGNIVFNGDVYENVWSGSSSTTDLYALDITDSVKDSNSISFVATGSTILALQQIIVVTTQKAPTTITAPAVTTVYNTNKNLVVTLKDSNGNAVANAKVTIVLNGAKKVLTTDAKGQATLAIPANLVPKTYTASISYDGDATHSKSSASAKVVVKKATPKLTAKNKAFKVKTKTKKYTVVLKNNKGKVMKKVKLTLKVKGKTYKATTNAKGKATFKITKLTKKGKYTAKVNFKGDKYFNKLTKKVKITVKK